MQRGQDRGPGVRIKMIQAAARNQILRTKVAAKAKATVPVACPLVLRMIHQMTLAPTVVLLVRLEGTTARVRSPRGQKRPLLLALRQLPRLRRHKTAAEAQESGQNPQRGRQKKTFLAGITLPWWMTHKPQI